MKIADFLSKTKVFLIRRIAELFGLVIIVVGVSIFLSLLSYSPDDPNFIVNESEEITNLLGFRGSVVSDFLFQSVGLIAYLIPLTLFFSGTNILITKRQVIIIENLFFCVLYIFCGSLFFAYFRDQSFFLTINGNGGFVGSFSKDSFFKSLLELDTTISYYSLSILTIILFFISINFRISKVLMIFNSFKNLLSSRNKTNITENNDMIKEIKKNEGLDQNTRTQDSFSFENKSETNAKKLILPNYT